MLGPAGNEGSYPSSSTREAYPRLESAAGRLTEGQNGTTCKLDLCYPTNTSSAALAVS